MLVRPDPFRNVDRLLSQFVDRAAGRPTVMPMDCYRHGDRFVAHLDLPGVDPDSIEVTVDDKVLAVSAARGWQPDQGDEVVFTERPQGSFRRQVMLGESLDVEHVDARYDNGVLTLTIPVTEAAKPRKVEITSGQEAKSAA